MFLIRLCAAITHAQLIVAPRQAALAGQTSIHNSEAAGSEPERLLSQRSYLRVDIMHCETKRRKIRTSRECMKNFIDAPLQTEHFELSAYERVSRRQKYHGTSLGLTTRRICAQMAR